MEKQLTKPLQRSMLRAKAGMVYYGMKRRLLWVRMKKQFAHEFQKPLPYVIFKHQTPLLRKLKDVEMQYQYNKIINLKLAVKKINGIVIHPHEVFSYWQLIGKPTRRKGYVDGMILDHGHFCYGIGGGLCQLSNLIFWMSIHTPLTIIERHRHGYDVFPDANRTQPFGSGATCFYPHGDLMIRNDTDQDYQLNVEVGETMLIGSWRALAPLDVSYTIIEKNHEMKAETWGYSRHNELYRQVYDLDGQLLHEEFLLSNHAMMMYSPYLEYEKNAQS